MLEKAEIAQLKLCVQLLRLARSIIGYGYGYADMDILFLAFCWFYLYLCLNTSPHLREAVRQTERGGRLLLDVHILLPLLLVVALKPKFIRLLLYWTVAVVVPELSIVVIA